MSWRLNRCDRIRADVALDQDKAELRDFFREDIRIAEVVSELLQEKPRRMLTTLDLAPDDLTRLVGRLAKIGLLTILVESTGADD